MIPRGRARLLLWVIFFAVCMAIVLRARFTADLSAFLPGSPTPEQRVLVDQIREGVVSQLILVGLEGAPPAELARLSEGLTGRLLGMPQFSYVSNGGEAQMQADGEFLLRHRYLLSPGVTAERFSVAGLRDALQSDLDLLASPLGSLMSRVLPADPTGELMRLLETLQLEAGPHKREGVWFSADGERALLIVRTRAPGFDIDRQEQALAHLRAAFGETVRELAIPQVRLLTTGPGVFAVATRATIKADVARISLLAVLGVCALLLAAYRSAWVLALTLVPVATGAAAGIAAVSVAFGSVHGITLGFGATLLGEGVDYAIYLFSAAAAPAASAAGGALWRTLRLGVLTSVCGFGAMLLSDFPGLAQLGLFSITGLIVAFAVTRLVLPELEPVRSQPLASVGDGLLRLAGMLSRLRIVLLILVIAAGMALIARAGSLWDDRLERLSPVPEADKELDAQLRHDLGAPDVRYLIVAFADHEQAALELAERVAQALEPLKAQGALTGLESPAAILPSATTQRQRQATLPDAATLKSRLTQAMTGLPFRADVFQPFLADVAQARQAPLVQRQDLATTGLRVRFDALLSERDGRWVASLPLRGVQDAAAIADAIARLNLPAVSLLDLKQETNALYRGYRGQALRFALIGAGAIVVLLLLSLRSLRRTFHVLAPLVAALIVTSAALTLGARELSLFHLVGMLLVVGVGSNYTLLFEPVAMAAGDARRTLTSVALCNLSTVIGFGLLATAHAPVLSDIGTTVALGAFLSVLFAAILSRAPGSQRAGTELSCVTLPSDHAH